MSALTHRTAGWRNFCIACIAALAAILPYAALAAIDIDSIDDFDFGTWTASQGDVASDSDFCVLSTRGNSGNPGDYSVTPNPLSSGTFHLSGPGGAAIPYTLTFVDLLNGGSEQLTPSLRTVRDKTGVSNCNGVQNARLMVAFSANDLAAAPTGTYQQSVSFHAQNNNGSSSFEIFTIVISIPDQVRISELDPIDLGSFDGVNDLSGVDDLCVYRNNGGADYRVVASADGAGGAFTLTNGVDVLPYRVDWDDGGGFVALSTGIAAAMTGANQLSIDCGGVNNAVVQVTVNGVDMSTAAPGVYASTLTLLIEPQ
jgi:hypothetical protein